MNWFAFSPPSSPSLTPEPIAYVSGPRFVPNGKSYGFHPDDARLIAAAPDLLALLIECYGSLDDIELCERVMSAITRATGAA